MVDGAAPPGVAEVDAAGWVGTPAAWEAGAGGVAAGAERRGPLGAPCAGAGGAGRSSTGERRGAGGVGAGAEDEFGAC